MFPKLKKNVYAQKIILKQLKGKPSKVVIFPEINGRTTNCGAQHFQEGIKKRPTLTSVRYFEKTTFSQRDVIHNMVTKAKLDNVVLKGGTDNHVVTMSRRKVGFKIKILLSTNQVFSLEKMMSVNTSIDNPDFIQKSSDVEKRANELHEILLKSTYNKELRLSNQEWKKIWNQFYLKIKGTSASAKYDAFANAFGIFHMNSFVPQNNANLSIGAKGLSGEGYQGHSFWDTEFFILPNYLFTNPKVARNLLEYRYKGLKGARDKAREIKLREEESNLKGAQYPWEMAWPTDGEVCPHWGQTNVITGEQVPVASRRQEIHVSADVAYAIHQYYVFTKDKSFMEKMGYEIIFDTAIFWSERAEEQNNGQYMIKDVMGPNEYKGNIDNNAFTNALAKFNLTLAVKYHNELQTSKSGQKILEKVLSKLPYAFSLQKIEKILKNLYQQKPNQEMIIPENDQFLELKRVDVRPFQCLGDAGAKLFSTKEGHKRLSAQLVKQADVVLLTYLFPHWFNSQIILKNFEFYEPITTHDSSLSPSTYAIQAIELRKMSLAYKLYKYSLNIDLGLNMNSSNQGIHAGSLAAIWQSTIFGYGGLRWFDDELHLNPILPKQWNSLSYKFSYQNVQIYVEIFKKFFKVKTLNDKTLVLKIYGKNMRISSKELKIEVQ